MSSRWKFALLAGAAACALGLSYAAPIFGADDATLPPHIEPLVLAETLDDNEALMAPVRREAAVALAKLQAAARQR